MKYVIILTAFIYVLIIPYTNMGTEGNIIAKNSSIIESIEFSSAIDTLEGKKSLPATPPAAQEDKAVVKTDDKSPSFQDKAKSLITEGGKIVAATTSVVGDPVDYARSKIGAFAAANKEANDEIAKRQAARVAKNVPNTWWRRAGDFFAVKVPKFLGVAVDVVIDAFKISSVLQTQSEEAKIKLEAATTAEPQEKTNETNNAPVAPAASPAPTAPTQAPAVVIPPAPAASTLPPPVVIPEGQKGVQSNLPTGNLPPAPGTQQDKPATKDTPSAPPAPPANAPAASSSSAAPAAPPAPPAPPTNKAATGSGSASPSTPPAPPAPPAPPTPSAPPVPGNSPATGSSEAAPSAPVGNKSLLEEIEKGTQLRKVGDPTANRPAAGGADSGTIKALESTDALAKARRAEEAKNTGKTPEQIAADLKAEKEAEESFKD